MKKAFITGISGQDGSYLSEYLLSLGYDVYGIIRRSSVPEHQESRIHHLEGHVTTFYGDVMDASSIEKVMAEVMPDEIYNLAAQSHVRISNAIGALNVLDAYRRICPKARFYQASSSEMFGNSVDADGFQRETTPMHPVSPYGCSKLFAYSMVRHFRKAYGLHAYNGILFNHESPRRASNFVTQKVIKGAIRIKMGLQDTLEMGRLDTHRDWGHSKDYVRAMHQIINHDTPDDFVVSTMQTHSVQEMIDYVFSEVGVSNDKVIQNPKYFRTEELKYLKGDSTKIREVIGWKPYYTFETLMDEMIEAWSENIPKHFHREKA
jgi:GDPmannose 4,6-dehydratase